MRRHVDELLGSAPASVQSDIFASIKKRLVVEKALLDEDFYKPLSAFLNDKTRLEERNGTLPSTNMRT